MFIILFCIFEHADSITSFFVTIVQGLYQMLEDKVSIRCRQKDEKLLNVGIWYLLILYLHIFVHVSSKVENTLSLFSFSYLIFIFKNVRLVLLLLLLLLLLIQMLLNTIVTSVTMRWIAWTEMGVTTKVATVNNQLNVLYNFYCCTAFQATWKALSDQASNVSQLSTN